MNTIQYTREINFNIGTVSINVVENDGNLDFTASASGVDDLRGLFFDFNNTDLLNSLVLTGEDITDQKIKNEGVVKLKQGNNLEGLGFLFDIGVGFGSAGSGKDIIGETLFTLSSTTTDLTLDAIANVEFGARTTSDGGKFATIAPAAPDAKSDVYGIFEDGQPGLASPTHTSIATKFEVLANDTDADGDILTIIDVRGAQHGTVAIVDGDDADSLPGDAVIYTPDTDYSGPDSFEYLISDNNGGTDFATVDVSIEAVADIPTLSYQFMAGINDNQVIVKVTTAQTDADSSEFIDRIALSGIPLTGVVVDPNGFNPIDEPDLIEQEFGFTLPLGEDSGFSLGITSVSKETSNGDEETAFQTLGIITDTHSIFEDGQAGLGAPSHVPVGTFFEAPAINTDATSNARTINIIRDVSHGSIEIVDGADADAIAGDAIIYTPDPDYSGEDSYTYAISDNNGNTDFVMTNISIDAVADIPSLQLEAFAVDGVANQIRIHVTTSTTDADGSEYIDRIDAQPLPAGVTLELQSDDGFYDSSTGIYNPSNTAGLLERDFILTLPLGQNQDFNLGFTAVAKESDIAGDEQESAIFELPIGFESQSVTENIEYNALQNQWGLGAEQSFDLTVPYHIFGKTFTNIGLLPTIDLALDKSILGGAVDIDGDFFFETGFNFNFSLKGGSIDAASNYSLGLTTNYNTTTDTVLVSSSKDLLSSSFDTTTPSLTFGLDFFYDLEANLKIKLDGGLLGSETLNVFNNIDESGTETVLPDTNLSELLALSVFAYPNPLNITPPPPAPQVPVPNPLAGPFFVNLDLPEIEIDAGPVASNVLVGAGESEIIIGLEVDVDKFLFPPTGLGFEASKLGFEVEASLLDFDVEGGLTINQEHTLTLADVLAGDLVLEDGTLIPYTVGEDKIIANLLSHDTNGDGDVDIQFQGSPLASFNNDTNLGLTFLYEIQALFAKAKAPVVGSTSVSVLNESDSITPVDIGIFDDTFNLAFEDVVTQSLFV